MTLCVHTTVLNISTQSAWYNGIGRQLLYYSASVASQTQSELSAKVNMLWRFKPWCSKSSWAVNYDFLQDEYHLIF